MEYQKPVNHSENLEQGQAIQYLQTLFDSAYQDGILSDKESLVFSLYHLEEDSFTLGEIGELFDVTESRVCQIMAKTIKKLRKRATIIQKHTLDDFI